MLNAGMHDTYVAPHVHDRPRKLEVFVILRGSIAVVTFDPDGNLADCAVLIDKGPVRAAEIPAGTWHSFVVLTRSAVVYELVDGRYDPRTHKHFARWAPDECDTRRASVYLKGLRRQLSLAAKKQQGQNRSRIPKSDIESQNTQRVWRVRSRMPTSPGSVLSFASVVNPISVLGRIRVLD